MQEEYHKDFSLKELILQVNAYIGEFLKYKFRIVIAGILAAVLLCVLNLNNPPRYKADLTFMLNEDARQGFGSLSGILGQFGFGIGQTESNLDKIVELSLSRNIAERTLFTETELNGSTNYLANHLISNFENEKKWYRKGLLSFGSSEDDLSLEGFHFSSANTEAFDIIDNKALKHLHRLLVGDKNTSPAFFSDYSEVTGIMQLSIVTANQDLSILFVNTLFDKLSTYYVEKAIEKQEYEYNIIKSKYDSIINRLSAVQYQLADFQDRYQNLFRQQDKLKEKQLRTEEQKLLLMIGEAEKQVQIASIALENRTPFIQLIDAPIPPIKSSSKSVLYFAVLGFFAGVFTSLLFLFARKSYRDIMNS
ncbi:MAG: hypothetical protein HKN09_12695 [Saprospiraceae bacterium]|nr:hypothetical protein [Saprospiraceae bacterium]